MLDVVKKMNWLSQRKVFCDRVTTQFAAFLLVLFTSLPLGGGQVFASDSAIRGCQK